MTCEELGKYTTGKDTSVVDAMQLIDNNTKGILFVINQDGVLLGSVTDGDIRRWLVKTGQLNAPLGKVMNRDPKFLLEDGGKQKSSFMKEMKIDAIPVVNKQMKILEICFNDQEQEHSNKKIASLKGVPVVIMAGGKGTRLYPYTKILPKPLIPIGDVPIMERIIERFNKYEIDKYWITVNYRKNMIRSYFSEVATNYAMEYVEEDHPLGTAGSLKLIKDKFERPIILSNCDILIDANYGEIYKHHQESGNVLTIVTALKNIVVPYGVINSKEDGEIVSMDEKPRLSYFVNTGMYVFDPEVINKIPQNVFYHMTDLAEQLIKDGEKVGMYPISENSFLDMGEFEEMHNMERKLNLKSE